MSYIPSHFSGIQCYLTGISWKKSAGRKIKTCHRSMTLLTVGRCESLGWLHAIFVVCDWRRWFTHNTQELQNNKVLREWVTKNKAIILWRNVKGDWISHTLLTHFVDFLSRCSNLMSADWNRYVLNPRARFSVW